MSRAFIVWIVTCWASAQAVAESPAPAPIELGVLHVENGERVVLPLFSYPFVEAQFPDTEHGELESRMEWPAEQTPQLVERCARDANGTRACKIPAALVTRHHAMRFTPEHWLDANGTKYETRGGYYFENAVGAGIAIDLGKATSPSGDVDDQSGRLVASSASVFPTTHVITDETWAKWPELARELRQWAQAGAARCGESASCRRAVEELAAVKALTGSAWEFDLGDGRKLQYLAALSRSRTGTLGAQWSGSARSEPDPAGDVLWVELWRAVDRDGKVTALEPDARGRTIGSIEWADPSCASQCASRWTARPAVFSVGDRTFIVGPYTGGTTYGYLLIEATGGRLEFIGRYRWGS